MHNYFFPVGKKIFCVFILPSTKWVPFVEQVHLMLNMNLKFQLNMNDSEWQFGMTCK